MERKVDFLAKVSLFANMKPEMLARLASQLTERKYANDSMLFAKDDPGDTLFIIVSGEVKIVLYSKSGREIVLAKFGSGDVFGEMSLLDGQTRSANAVTMKETTLLTLRRKDFERFIQAEPGAALELLKEISIRLRTTNEKVGDLALIDVYGRVARYILRLAREEGEEMDVGHFIPKLPTHQEIANMLGTARETVCRAMSLFQKNGYVHPTGDGVYVSFEGEFAEKYSQL